MRFRLPLFTKNRRAGHDWHLKFLPILFAPNNMKLTYFAALAMSSMLTVGTAAVSLQPAYANPCAANPCAATAVNPCAADPCAANPCAANPCAADPCAAAANPCAAASSTGSFKTVSSDTAGGATIVEENGKRYLEFDDTFSTENGPDLFVLLHKEATPESYSSGKFVNLGDLQSIAGSQRYEIPEDVSVEDFQSAVIWCRQFNVTFGFAAI